MLSFSDLPISRKLTVAFTLSSVVIVLLPSTAFFVYEFKTSRRTFADSIATSARITADNSTAVIAFNDSEGAGEILDALRGESQILVAALFDDAGARLATYRRDEQTGIPSSPRGEDGTRMERGRLICIQPVVEGERRLGTLYVEATLARLHSRWAAYGWFVLSVALIVTAIGWALGRLLQRRIARPIVELAETARRITRRRDYSLRARAYGRDELGSLARDFNDMLDRMQDGVVALERAATEVRDLNTQLEQRVGERTAELEEANRELESFSYSVSHDLRAPLRHIQGYADMLERATNGSLPEKAQRYLQVITDASGEMGELIDDLLAFSRMGRVDLREDVVDVGRLIEEVRKGLELATKDRAVKWNIETLPPVLADASMLKLALANLIGNAVKFTRRRNPAEISVRCVGHEGDHVVLCVNDNGVGFDMAYYEKLFGVFQRLHRVDDFEGTGIGLANVRRIIGRHGGRVWAEGKPDVGASFFFTLKSANGRAIDPQEQP